jgi:hypothetical protein
MLGDEGLDELCDLVLLMPGKTAGPLEHLTQPSGGTAIALAKFPLSEEMLDAHFEDAGQVDQVFRPRVGSYYRIQKR